ncbi:MAG: hypothetical protein Q9217_001201 [Psora testacea]
METAICITDGTTLVDHIHEIKSWIYDGQLRLIVPSSTVENVEQLYQKSIEPKLPAKEATNLKSLVKLTKKEYPTFDANPRIAKAFLERVKAGKDYETGQLGRPIYEEEEKHAAVHFAQANEHYTPWKHIEEYEVKTESPTDGQGSWADKLRKKPSLANGTAANKLPKGPAKPKLVSKSGAENSPWKVRRNAPTISATDVPTLLRPMMSCALWRIHESIHRNDENQLFVLTDQQNVENVAERLNIIVRSVKQLREALSGRGYNGDLNTYGDLEREFGLQPTRGRPHVEIPARMPKEGLTDGFAQEDGIHRGKEVAEESQDSQKSRIEELAKESPTDLPMDHDVDGGTIRGICPDVQTQETLPIVTLGIGSHLLEKDVLQAQTDLAREDGKQLDENKKRERSAIALTEDLAVAKSSAKHASEETPIQNVQLQPSANIIWSRSFADALTGNTSNKALPVSIADNPSRAPLDPTTSPTKSSEQVVTPSKAPEEPEDSDEEVVVFQPKRLSAQKKSTQRSSRPSTPNVQPQHPPAAQSPRASTTKSHAITKPLTHTAKVVNAAIHPQPRQSNGPLPIIDPDAFGRGFAINTSPHPRGGSVRGMRSRHSPQSSVKNAVFDPSRPVSRPSSAHRQPRASPVRELLNASPHQVPRTPMHINDSTEKAQPMQMPIGTGRPLSGPTADLRTQMINAPVFQPGSASNPTLLPSVEHSSMQISGGPATQAPIGSGRPSSKASQQPANATPIPASTAPSGPSQHDPHFVRNLNPRTSAAAPQQDPDVVRNDRAGPPRYPSPQQYKSNPANPSYAQTPSSGRQHNRLASPPNGGSLPRPKGGAAPRSVKPSLFEPTLDHTRAYQPDTLEPRGSAVPEVQYVLKSGSTREQARGKGKLWVG